MGPVFVINAPNTILQAVLVAEHKPFTGICQAQAKMKHTVNDALRQLHKENKTRRPEQ